MYGIDGADGSIEWTFVTPGTSVWALEQLDDVNGKGAQEIIAGDFGGYIYTLDPETGGQLYSTSAGGNLLIRFVKLDDVNGDGFTDILLAYSGSNGVVLSGYDLSTLWFQPLADKAWVADRINDVSGDMINDAIIGTLFSNNYCYFLDGTTGEELSPIPYGSPLDAIRAIPDIVGDHSMEMVAGGRNGMLTCYSGGINTATAVPETPGSANGIMAHIFPNPFIAGSGNGTTISYAIDEAAYVGIHIYDMQGRLIACPESGYRQQGMYTASWDGAGLRLAPGLYFCRISAGSQSVTLKMTLM